MSGGGGGGIIIIRSIVESGRCTDKEHDRLVDILEKQPVICTIRDALAAAHIVFKLARRP